MFDLEQDLKELGYEIVWKQTLKYIGGGQIVLIGAIHAPIKHISCPLTWTCIVKFSGSGPQIEGSGGFLYKFLSDDRELGVQELMRVYESASLAPAKVC